MLSPYRVLDLTDERGQLAGALLAQLGAEVVAVEPPEGTSSRRLGPFGPGAPGPSGTAPDHGERSLWHRAYNRGKRSVRLDQVDLGALAATADVLIESGALPVDLDALRQAHPALVTVSISPFGTSGPKAGWAASDLTVLAAGGQLALTGDADRPPVRISVPQAFLHASAEAAGSALVALQERARSGRGQHVDVSAQQCVLQCTQTSVLAAAVGAVEYGRVAGGIKVGPYTLRLVYPASDGFVSITFLFGAMVGAFTTRLMRWVHEAGHCSDELRDLDYIGFFDLIFSGRLDPGVLTQATDAVASLTATMTKAELLEQAGARRLLIAPVATTADVAASEQLAARGFWEVVDGAPHPGPWVRAGGTPLPPLGPPPRLGEAEADLGALYARRPEGGPEGQASPAGAPPATPAPAAGRALDGLKVLDFSWAIAAPMATRVLADHGATVVRIETELRPDAIRGAGPFIAGTPGGMEDTAQWHSVNAGKRSLQLNLGQPEARQVALDLVRWADVVVESFTPGAMGSWGLSPAELLAVNPGVIVLSSCLMGQTGPLRSFAGFGNLAGAITGFYEVTGWPDRPPAGPFLAYTDYTSPRLIVVALLAALDHRRRTGQGQHLDLSQGEAALHFLAPALLDQAVNGRVAARVGNDDVDHAPHGVYPVGAPEQDRWIAIACTSDDAWRRLATELGRPELGPLDGGERLARRRELDEMVAGWTAGQDGEALQVALQALGVAAHQVQNSSECLADPQLAWRQHFRSVPHPIHGSCWVEGPHVTFSRTPPEPAWAGPTLGQHTDHVLRELLGYDDDQVTALVIADALH